MDFSRKHRIHDDDAPDDLSGSSVTIHFAGVEHTLTGTLVSYRDMDDMTDEERAAWEEPAPRPCYRSIWQIFGLRRRPKRLRRIDETHTDMVK